MDDIEDKLEEQRNNSKTDLQKLIESKVVQYSNKFDYIDVLQNCTLQCTRVN